MECITTWGKAGTPKTSKEEKTQLGCPSFRGNWNVRKRFKRKPADQPILLAIHQDLWLSVGLHKRTRCCHCQWKCYRPLKSICAANRRDQCYSHQLLDDLHPNVSTCAAVWRLQRIFCGRQHTFLKKNDLPIDMLCSKLDQDPCLIYQSYIHIKYMYSAYMHLYRNHINLSNKNYSDITKSLDSGLQYRAWSWPKRCVYWNLMQIKLKFSTCLNLTQFLGKRFSFHFKAFTKHPQSSQPSQPSTAMSPLNHLNHLYNTPSKTW